MFTPIAIGIATVAMLDAHVIGEAPGQPTSTTLRLRPKRSDIACAAGPSSEFIIVTIRLSPTKPTPIISPERIALPGLTPTQMLKIAITIGSMTDAPILIM